MKTSMKKALSLVLVVCTLFACVIIPGQVITASAAEPTATISFTNTAQRTSFSTTQQVWEQNGIKVTNNKSKSTSNIADYANPARFYKNSEIIIEYPQMTKIEITCNTSSYATTTMNSISGSAVSGSTVTITFDSPVDSFTFTASAQIHFNSITVTYNVDETLDIIREKLNDVDAYMSLGYKYSAITTTETVTTVTDTLNRGVTGITSGSYKAWSFKPHDNGATYMGQSAGSYNSIQLRTDNSNSGIVTTARGGKVAKITVVWNSKTTAGRTLDIYGKNTQYSATTDLYGSDSDAGTKIGSIVCGTSTELVIEGDYKYIGLRSKSGAMYIDSIEIVWDTGGTEVTTTYSDSAFAIRCAVDSKLADIAIVTAYGIKVSAGDKEVCYTADASSWTVDGGLIYIVLNLGDIINDKAKLSTRFTIAAFVEYNGNKVVSTNVKAHSVASMIDEYNTNQQIAEVEHLYNYLVENKLIDENA